MAPRSCCRRVSPPNPPATSRTSAPNHDKRGLVMVCDVDFRLPDATRTHSVEIARGFAQVGLEVDLVARGPDPEVDGVRYWPAAGLESQRLIRLVTINGQAIRLLWCRRQSASRFYVRDNWSCFPAMLASRLLGYRVVTQVDGIPYDRMSEDVPFMLAYIKLIIAVAIGRLYHGLLAVTPEIKQLLVELARVPPDRIAVVPNGVDVEFFKPVPRDEAIEACGLDPICRYIVFCGGLYPWSDFDTILDAFSIVAAARPDARLLLVGDGPERDRITRRASELQITYRVILTGMVHDRRRVRDYLGAATVALLAYRVDKVNRTSASPIKLTEYLAAGRAVVAVDIPGIRDIVQGNRAGLVVPGAPDPVAEAILELLDPERADALGAAGRLFAERRLSWHSVVKRTLPLFRLPVTDGVGRGVTDEAARPLAGGGG